MHNAVVSNIRSSAGRHLAHSRFKASKIGLLPVGNPPTASALGTLLLSIVIANGTHLSASHDHLTDREEARAATKPTLDPAGPMTGWARIATRSDVSLQIALRS